MVASFILGIWVGICLYGWLIIFRPKKKIKQHRRIKCRPIAMEYYECSINQN